MGRKSKNTVSYFPHFVDNSKTKSILKGKYGLVGYSTWFQLLEILCKSKGHYFDCRDEWSYEWLLSEIGIDKDIFEEIMEFLARFEKIDFELWDRKIIWCQNLVDNLEHVYQKRISEMPQKPSFLIQKVTENGISGAENGIPGDFRRGNATKQSKAEQSKEKKSRVKQRESEIPPPKPPMDENGKLSAYLLDLPFKNAWSALLELFVMYEISKKPTAKKNREKKVTALIDKYDNDFILEKIKHFHWCRLHRSELLGKNPVGYLIKSIESQYPPPSGYEEWQERELKQKRVRETIRESLDDSDEEISNKSFF